MVLGLRSSKNKNASVCVHYVVHIQEIKPWPPSQSLKAVRSVVLVWENGDSSSGTTTAVTPSVGSTAAEGKIEINQTFRLEVVFKKEGSAKGNDKGTFQKNLLEFNLYEPRRDKSKGQHLGTATIDLATHGAIRKAETITIPVDSKRNFRNTAQPLLSIVIQPFDKNSASSSSMQDLSKESPMVNEGKESGFHTMNDDSAEEAEIASFTDDDVSSQSSLAISPAAEANGDFSLRNSPDEKEKYKDTSEDWKESKKLGSDESCQQFHSLTAVATVGNQVKAERRNNDLINNGESLSTKEELRMSNGDILVQDFEETIINHDYKGTDTQKVTKADSVNEIGEVGKSIDVSSHSVVLEKVEPDQDAAVHTTPQGSKDVTEEAVSNHSEDCEASESQSTIASDYIQNVSITTVPDKYREDIKEIDVQEDENENGTNSSINKGISYKQNGSSDLSKVKHVSGVKRNMSANNKLQELELRVQLLEAELREAAAVEISLYSIIAEHGSSAHKVHSPCRRLSRVYRHTLEKGPVERIASTARCIISGLTLVARTCGNDVPRLTFWLSNIIVLRATVSGTIVHKEVPVSVGSYSADKTSRRLLKSKPSSWNQESVSPTKEFSLLEDFDDWEDPRMLLSSLKNIETWVFDRIVESVWWQALTPYMQSAKDNVPKMRANSKKSFGKTSSMGDQHEASIKTWKIAFQDALARLCPVRSGRHKCGCLHLLAKLVMEQCIARLDVAMFNAILRDSDDDMSMDPLSDPIYNLKALPISSRVLTFGLGAQLKNAIGSWSRCLSDLFGMDDDDSPCDENEQNAFKPFSLLNALSDILMIPKDMLLEKSIHNEAFPKFSPSLIKRIISQFQPDDFCPYPVPPNVLRALDSEESLEDEEIKSIPCSAPPIIYCPPTTESIESIVGEMQSSSPLCRNGTLLVRKGHTSDDELEELDSPLSSIATNSFCTSKVVAKGFNCPNAIRYKLLKEVWEDDE